MRVKFLECHLRRIFQCLRVPFLTGLLGTAGEGVIKFAWFTFVVPAGTAAPHFMFDGPGANNRGVNGSAIRISQVPFLNPNPYGFGAASGVVPTGWSTASAPNGITRTITPGNNYVDIRVSGTPTGNSGFNITFNGTSDTPAALGDALIGEVDMAIIDAAGLSSLTSARVRMYEMDANGSSLASGSTAQTLQTARTTYNTARTLNQAGVGGDGGVKAARMRFEFDFTAATPVDVTFRIYAAGLRRT